MPASVTVTAFEIKGPNFSGSFGHSSLSVSYASEVFWPPQKAVITTTIRQQQCPLPNISGRVRLFWLWVMFKRSVCLCLLIIKPNVRFVDNLSI